MVRRGVSRERLLSFTLWSGALCYFAALFPYAVSQLETPDVPSPPHRLGQSRALAGGGQLVDPRPLPLSLSLTERFPALRNDSRWLGARNSFEGSEVPSTETVLNALAVLTPVMTTGPGEGERGLGGRVGGTSAG